MPDGNLKTHGFILSTLISESLDSCIQASPSLLPFHTFRGTAYRFIWNLLANGVTTVRKTGLGDDDFLPKIFFLPWVERNAL